MDANLLEKIDLRDIYYDKSRKPNELYVSILTFCPRKEVLSYYFKPAQYVKSDEILAGEYLHKVIQEQLKQQGYEVEKGVSYELKDDFKLVGRIDAVNSDHIIEIKTVKKFIDFNVNYWFTQVNMYMHMSGIRKAKLLVVERPTGQMFMKEIDYDKEKAEGVLSLAEQVVDAIKNADFTIIPRCNDYRCKYCEFNIICKKV